MRVFAAYWQFGVATEYPADIEFRACPFCGDPMRDHDTFLAAVNRL